MRLEVELVVVEVEVEGFEGKAELGGLRWVEIWVMRNSKMSCEVHAQIDQHSLFRRRGSRSSS